MFDDRYFVWVWFGSVFVMLLSRAAFLLAGRRSHSLSRVGPGRTQGGSHG